MILTHRSNEQWAKLIHAKIAHVLNTPDNSLPTPPLADLSSPDDPRFPHAIDHTLLTPDATTAQIDRLCDEAVRFKFKSCCVNGSNVRQVFERMAQNNSNTLVCCVVGFPLGAASPKAKAYEATQAIADGAREIDTVVPLGALKSSNFCAVYTDIHTTVQASHPYPVKVIIETSFLTTEEKIAACYLAAEAGAAFVKTCTGFAGGSSSPGATKEDVSLMWRTVAYMEGRVKVKASGGIRSFEKAQDMFKAGAERLGTYVILSTLRSSISAC
ncbi:Deoxyribose-phosphate aldolase [Leucoagaricus sp. SymC.cos]|nr:Deoxyribose-phosphate aldolase [Leucoagaricus sp. SymC.cos]